MATSGSKLPINLPVEYMMDADYVSILKADSFENLIDQLLAGTGLEDQKMTTSYYLSILFNEDKPITYRVTALNRLMDLVPNHRLNLKNQSDSKYCASYCHL